jgi:aspartate 1-decarboxylase
MDRSRPTQWVSGRPNKEIMEHFLLKSKIHRATVTSGNLDYEGSLTLSADLMAQVGLLPYERILCGNMANGERFETYAIAGKAGQGECILNGAVAHLGKKGDLLTIMSFTSLTSTKARGWKPRVIVLGRGNRVVKTRGT